MRNWVVAKNWQMRNYLLFYANLPGDFMRNCFVAYGLRYYTWTNSFYILMNLGIHLAVLTNVNS